MAASRQSHRSGHLYEHRSQPLLPRRLFVRRLLLHAGVAFALVGVSLGIGVLGYRVFEGLPWIDAFLNASMILGGMGEINVLRTDAGKIFASIYALFSGGIFLAVASILIAPIGHRIMHRLHLEGDES